ncbi:hypothetical protein VpasPP24_22 [Vibrio phage Vpas_PP24]|nr:hypothetical protein VpasPP24_22 [Vibrio phage Vpas_PP24]
MTLQERIKNLAFEMGVSESDVVMFAQGILVDIVRDGAATHFTNGDADTQKDFIEAYSKHQVRKFEAFTTTYLTNSEARETFIKTVFSHLKQEIHQEDQVDESTRV